MKSVVVTGSRADAGVLEPVATVLEAEWIDVSTANSTSYLDQVELCSGASLIAANAIGQIKPDLVVLLGDRYEILGAATAAYLSHIPLAHLSGGDLTQGSQDDSIRHAITKLAHLHFPTCQESANRILQMGEEPWRVSVTGCPGIDGLLNTQLLGRGATLQALGISGAYILVAYQPATLSPDMAAEASALCMGLWHSSAHFVFTSLNADVGSREVQKVFQRFCEQSGRGKIVPMDRKLFLSAMKHCSAMVGNSSSGLYEAPTLQKAFVNVGDRQKGRLKAASVIDCKPDSDSVHRAIYRATYLDCSKVINPYGDGNAATRIRDQIVSVMRTTPRERLLTKRWIDVQANVGADAC